MHKRPNLRAYHFFHYCGINYKVRCQVIGKGNTTCLFIRYLYPMPLASLLYCTFIIDYPGSNVKSKGSFLCTFTTQLTLDPLSFKSYQQERICTQRHINQHAIYKHVKSKSKDYVLLTADGLLPKNLPSAFLHLWTHYFYETLWECAGKYQTNRANILKSSHDTGYLKNTPEHIIPPLLSGLPPVIINYYCSLSMLIMTKGNVFRKITQFGHNNENLGSHLPRCHTARLVPYRRSWLSKDPDAKLRRIFLSQ